MREKNQLLPHHTRIWRQSWSWLDLQLHMPSVPITTKVVSSNPIHGEMYSIQHYVIKFVSDLPQVCVIQLPRPIKLTAMI